MSPSIYAASGVVIVACIGFMVVGSVYHWDVTSPGYGRWTRVVGGSALLTIAPVAVSDRLGEPMVAFAAFVVGGLLTAGFVWAHRALSARLTEQMAARRPDDDSADDANP